jgi:hypothetical protein
MIDGNDYGDRVSLSISGKSAGSVAVFLPYPIVCLIFQDSAKDRR